MRRRAPSSDPAANDHEGNPLLVHIDARRARRKRPRPPCGGGVQTGDIPNTRSETSLTLSRESDRGESGMPFRGMSAMDQKREFVRLATMEGANIRELCRRFGVSSPTAYTWLRRYREEGLAGLLERSRRPKASPRRSATAVEAKVLAVRDRSNNAWGGRKIKRALEDRGQIGYSGSEHDHRDFAPARPLDGSRRDPASGALAALRAGEPERALADGLQGSLRDARRALPSADCARRLLALQPDSGGLRRRAGPDGARRIWKKPSAAMACRSPC